MNRFFSCLLVVAFFVGAKDDPYLKLIGQIDQKYHKEFPQTTIEIADPLSFPYYCSDQKENKGSLTPVSRAYPDPFFCYIQVTDTLPLRVQVAVRYWSPSPQIYPKIIWNRLHFYQYNTKGSWFEYQNSLYVTQVFDSVVTVNKKKFPVYSCSK